MDILGGLTTVAVPSGRPPPELRDLAEILTAPMRQAITAGNLRHAEWVR